MGFQGDREIALFIFREKGDFPFSFMEKGLILGRFYSQGEGRLGFLILGRGEIRQFNFRKRGDWTPPCRASSLCKTYDMSSLKYKPKTSYFCRQVLPSLQIIQIASFFMTVNNAYRICHSKRPGRLHRWVKCCQHGQGWNDLAWHTLPCITLEEIYPIHTVRNVFHIISQSPQ